MRTYVLVSLRLRVGSLRDVQKSGARLLEVFPMLPLIANEPLGVGALSYAGALNIGVVADRDAYPDLDAFVAGAREELATLGVSIRPTSTLEKVRA